jgi:NAD(P)-dependent dehydrogenase (short-subunit alcohol dehydrogenase family)
MSDKVLLITGGGRGIGAATARMAASRDYLVAVNYLSNSAAADAVVKEIRDAGGKAAAIRADVSKDAEIPKLFDAAEKEFGRVTHFVNNVGIIGRSSKLADADPAMIREVIDTNTTAAILAAREAVLRMSKSKGGGGGSIVNVSSMAAVLGSPGEYTWYAASKGAVESFTVGLAKEVAADGIRVNCVSPGVIETGIHAAGGQPDRLARIGHLSPIPRPGRPEEIASAILWLLSEEASYATGSILRVTGGR